MRIYLKNNLDKFHGNPIWNDRALDFFEQRLLEKNQKKKKNEMNSDMG